MKKTLRNHCPPTLHNGLQWPHAPILALQNHKILFCPIAKNACTSLKRLMASLSAIEHRRLLLAEDIHRGIDQYRTGLKLLDLDLDQAREIMRSDEYFKFAVIRDPFTRLVSVYLEKFVINRLRKPNHYHTGPVVAAVQGREDPDFERSITFAQFVRHITTQPADTLDPHWKPQVLYLEGIHYDRIYRMDQLDLLCQDLALRVGHAVQLERQNVSQKSQSRFAPEALHQYADEMRRPQIIDKRSFFDSELMYAIAEYFTDDYRLYVAAAKVTRRAEAPMQKVSPQPGVVESGNQADAAPEAKSDRRSTVRTVRGRGQDRRPRDLRRWPLERSDVLFFLHLPKCGGTTFNELLHQMFPGDGEVYQNPYRRKELLDTPSERLREVRLIRGHFQYPDVVAKLGFAPRAVTFLRDPIARFISHYRMRRSPNWNPRNPAERAYQAKVREMSFEQFLQDTEMTGALANLQYRFLAGFRMDQADVPHCRFEQPYDGLLDNFEVVGLLDRFDESLEVFCHAFDLPPILSYRNKNVNTRGAEEPEPTADALTRIADLNYHDLQLYARAQKRFEEQLRQLRAEQARYPDGLPMLEEPQESLKLDMSRLPPGNNWWSTWQRRPGGSGRWTGPGPAAHIYLPLAAGDKHVRLTVVDAATRGALRSLRLEVGGKEVPLSGNFQLRRFPRTFTGTIPGDAIQMPRRTQLILRVSETRHPWKNAPIKAGVCVGGLEVRPVALAADDPATKRSRPAA
jgi:hypothetical protein